MNDGVTISNKQFFQYFSDEKKAREFFERAYWGDKPKCPKCGHDDATKLQREGYYRCRKCSKYFSVKCGTFLHRTKIPLVDWLYAIYSMFISRKGISSLELSKDLVPTSNLYWG